ncbi:hypothetical protein RFI_13955, partial [Reticulomyxa filosa]
VAEHVKDNQMSLESLAISFSPNLVRHEDPSHLLKLQQNAQRIWKLLCELRQLNQLGTTTTSLSVPYWMEEYNNKKEEFLDEESILSPLSPGVNATLDMAATVGHQPLSRRTVRSISVVYSTGVHELYRPSFYSGAFGSFHYPLKDSFHAIRRSVVLHSEEFKMQAVLLLYILSNN